MWTRQTTVPAVISDIHKSQNPLATFLLIHKNGGQCRLSRSRWRQLSDVRVGKCLRLQIHACSHSIISRLRTLTACKTAGTKITWNHISVLFHIFQHMRHFTTFVCEANTANNWNTTICGVFLNIVSVLWIETLAMNRSSPPDRLSWLLKFRLTHLKPNVHQFQFTFKNPRVFICVKNNSQNYGV